MTPFCEKKLHIHIHIVTEEAQYIRGVAKKNIMARFTPDWLFSREVGLWIIFTSLFAVFFIKKTKVICKSSMSVFCSMTYMAESPNLKILRLQVSQERRNH